MDLEYETYIDELNWLNSNIALLKLEKEQEAPTSGKYNYIEKIILRYQVIRDKLRYQYDKNGPFKPVYPEI
jgi:hypothetical protein